MHERKSKGERPWCPRQILIIEGGAFVNTPNSPHVRGD